jgi:hypothetical protein
MPEPPIDGLRVYAAFRLDERRSLRRVDQLGGEGEGISPSDDASLFAVRPS